MTSAENPYASPATDTSVEPVGVLATIEVEELRRKYVKHEASVRSVGTLYYIGGAILGLMILAIIVGSFVGGVGWPELLVLLFYAAMAALSFVLGAGLRRFDGRVKIPVIILSAIGLLGFPVGTVINAYILYLMLSFKSKMVFSPYYHEIIAQTPHIKYRTSLLAWVVLIIVVVVIVGSMVAFVFLPIFLDRLSR